MKVGTKNAAVTIRLMDNTTISGKINLAGGNESADRISEYLYKTRDKPFLTVYDAYISDYQGDEDIFINKAAILWIKPDEELI